MLLVSACEPKPEQTISTTTTADATTSTAVATTETTTTTTTTAVPTTTTTTTPGPCPGCYVNEITVSATDLADATGNTDTGLNGKLFVEFRDCANTPDFVDFTLPNPYGICALNTLVPILTYWKNDVEISATFSTVVATVEDCCYFVPTTTTTTTAPPTTTTTSTTEGTTTTTSTTADITPPSKVMGLVLSTPIDYTVGVAWDAATDNVGVTGYEVQYNENSAGWSAGYLSSGTSTSQGGFTGGSNVEVRVRAQDAANNFGVWSAIASIIVTGI